MITGFKMGCIFRDKIGETSFPRGPDHPIFYLLINMSFSPLEHKVMRAKLFSVSPSLWAVCVHNTQSIKHFIKNTDDG